MKHTCQAGPMVVPCLLNVSVTGSNVLSSWRSRKSLWMCWRHKQRVRKLNFKMKLLLCNNQNENYIYQASAMAGKSAISPNFLWKKKVNATIRPSRTLGLEQKTKIAMSLQLRSGIWARTYSYWTKAGADPSSVVMKMPSPLCILRHRLGPTNQTFLLEIS